MLLYLSLGSAAQAFHPALGLAWTEVFVFLLPAGAAAAGSNLRPGAFLLLSRRPRAPLLALGLALGAALFVAAGGIMALTTLVVPRAWVDAFDLSRLFAGPAWQRVAMAAVASVLAPVAEEVAFRGYVQSALGTRARPAAAILGGGLLFALMHLDPVRFPAVLLLGVAFGWLAWRAGSLWPAVAAHVANNALGSGLALSGEADPATGATLASGLAAVSVGLACAAPVALVYWRSTPSPPPAGEAVVPRDPAGSTRFRPSRVPAWYAAAWLAGLASLLGLALLAAGLSP
jgi:hypothetical protein